MSKREKIPLPPPFREEDFSHLPLFACRTHGTHDTYMKIWHFTPSNIEERRWCMLCIEDLLLKAGLEPMKQLE